jgi:hypothetical protein
MHLDICMQWNQLEALFIFSLFSHYSSTCFGFASSPSSGDNNVYMRQLLRVVRLCRLSAGLDHLSNIYIVTSWWWAISKPETCRVMYQVGFITCIRSFSVLSYSFSFSVSYNSHLSTFLFYPLLFALFLLFPYFFLPRRKINGKTTITSCRWIFLTRQLMQL